jgi:hydroxyethylthiazole kinase-like uncharacterized protein yjeF
MRKPDPNLPSLWLHAFPQPRPDDHKYNRGHVGVVSGGLSSTGAARLGSHAALRTGAGLVTLCSPRNALLINAMASLSVMVRRIDSAGELSNFILERKVNALVLGPGGGVGKEMRGMVAAALKSKAACVLDADALTSFAGRLASLSKMIGARKAATVLTPHEGEFVRLFKGKEFAKAASKTERALSAARLTGTIVVLKGAGTVVATPKGKASVAANAPPTLATAGAGDVLSGMIAGLLAQGMEASLAASAAVWLHGEAAKQFGPGLIAEDLSEQLPSLFRRILKG